VLGWQIPINIDGKSKINHSVNWGKLSGKIRIGKLGKIIWKNF